MRTHYGHWHQKHKSGRGPFNEHFWQVWLKSVQRFQRRRFKCEMLTDGRTDDECLPMTKAHMAYGRFAIFSKIQFTPIQLKIIKTKLVQAHLIITAALIKLKEKNNCFYTITRVLPFSILAVKTLIKC